MNACRTHRCNQGRLPCPTRKACGLVTSHGGAEVDTDVTEGPWDWLDRLIDAFLFRLLPALIALALLGFVLTLSANHF